MQFKINPKNNLKLEADTLAAQEKVSMIYFALVFRKTELKTADQKKISELLNKW